ncbi:hypothetical protein [Aquimarina longa]|uniref:hypothetical protein n=1 Tax=Aquimarina longa TaxID=1080221 RepID=UPI0011DF6710|nr:hypothetical protein [Aquimarina longa]
MSKLICKILVFILLTITTQIGGILYILVEFSTRRSIHKKYRLKKVMLFTIAYLVMTFLIVPYIAPIFGREKIKDTKQIESHRFITKLLNRNYVNPELYNVIKSISNSLRQSNRDISLIYLDANFPFIDGFPLFPHLSHTDGKKIDISFIYKDSINKITNQKPSISGYGVFEAPIKQEYNQIQICKKKGYWYYDFTKYITLGTVNNTLKISEKATKDLLLAIIAQPQIGKIFIEPHLKNRLKIHNPKIRFHGCQAVRHDDHIHLQLK